MEAKKVSLRNKVLRELDIFLRISQQRPSNSKRMEPRTTSQTSYLNQNSCTEGSRSTLNANISNTEPVPSSSRVFTVPEIPNSINPFSIQTLQRRPQAPRRTERIKSIKRKPRPPRSSSLFYLQIGEEASNPNKLEQNRSRPVQRAASVDDLLGISEPQESNSSPTEAVLPPGRTESGDLLLFEPEHEIRETANENQEESSLLSTESSSVNGSQIIHDRNRGNELAEMLSTNLRLPLTSSSQSGSDNFQSTLSLDSFLNQSSRLSRIASPQIPPSQGCSTNSLSSIAVSSASSSTSIETLSTSDSPEGLRLREKVVWFTEKDVPEVGIIKWLGKIKGKDMAGVEFNNCIGNTSGSWNGRKLFSAVLTRGRFVPVPELILYSDFNQKIPNNAPGNAKFPAPDSGETLRTGTIVCVICQDPLVPIANEDIREEEKLSKTEMITTHCGHLFHQSCLKTWFNLKKKQIQPCPYCQRMMNIDELIRIYPVQIK